MGSVDPGTGGIIVRPARAKDVAALRELVLAAYRHYVPRIGAEPGPMRADYAEVVARGGTWVAEDRGAVVGLLVLVEAADHLLVENVAVAPVHQGRGLGRRLLDLAEERARALGVEEIRLYTHERMTENRAIYAARGYRETHRDALHGLHRVHLAKRLGPERPVQSSERTSR